MSLPELQVKTDSAKVTSCFVPSETGKKFEVRWQDHEANRHCSVRVAVDGRKVNGKVNRPRGRGKRNGIRTSISTLLPFQFSELVMSDDDDLMTAEAVLQNIGSIVVSIVRIQPVHEHDQIDGFQARGLPDIGPVNERSKKAGSHCVSFGQPQPCPARQRLNVRSANPSEGPFATFIFHYRPYAVLQAKGIASGSAPARPIPVQHKKRTTGPPQDSDDRKMRRISRSTTLDDMPDVKADPLTSTTIARITRPQSRTISGGVIDLTDEVKWEFPPLKSNLTFGDVVDLTLDDD